MEKKFLEKWQKARLDAANLGVRLRPMELTMSNARRALGGNRVSDGFWLLADLGRLDLSLEALVVSRAFTGLFTDQEANTALTRLLDANYFG